MGIYGDQLLDDIRSRVALVEVIAGAGITLKSTSKPGEFVGLCPFHAENTGSFTVTESKGFYHCFGCEANGDGYNFFKAFYGLDFAGAVERMADMAGVDLPDWHARNDAPPKLTPRPQVERPSGEDLKEEIENKILLARNIWQDCGRIPGTFVEPYLEGRGLDLSRLPMIGHVLRYHGRMMYGRGEFHPAMVGVVMMQEGDHRRIVGIHRTYLKITELRDDPLAGKALETFPGASLVKGPSLVVGKAEVEFPKKMLGPCYGGAVRFARAEEEICIAEGIETALSIIQATGRPTWAALSLGGMGAVVLPKQVRRVILCADSDAKDKKAAGEALQRAAEKHIAAGREVRIAHAVDGQDFNDMIQTGETDGTGDNSDEQVQAAS